MTRFGIADWTLNTAGVHVQPAYDIGNPGAGHDAAVLTLASDAPVAPLPWFGGGVFLPPGSPFTVVGFGATDANGTTDSRKRSVVVALDAGDANFFSSDSSGGAGPCFGDTGGPAIAEISGVDTVIGTVSFGDQNCALSAYYQRTSAEAAFLATYAPDAGAPLQAVASAAALAVVRVCRRRPLG